MDKAKLFLIIFSFASILDLGNVAFNLPFRAFTKSLIIPSLALYFSYKTPKRKSFYLFLAALFFAWLGDVFLLFEGEKFFIFGLGSFLVMQIIYTLIFLKDWTKNQLKLITSILLLVGFALYFNYYLWPFTTELRVPIISYSIAICAMAFAGINRSKEIDGYGFIALGVILFVISDSILAFNSFGPGVIYGGVLVMSTYILAQYFIVEGYSRYLKSGV